MLGRIILAVVVAGITILACILVGGLLMELNFNPAYAVGAFLKTYATVIGILAGLWYFFKGHI